MSSPPHPLSSYLSKTGISGRTVAKPLPIYAYDCKGLYGAACRLSQVMYSWDLTPQGDNPVQFLDMSVKDHASA
jgi:hypothetical protein